MRKQTAGDVRECFFVVAINGRNSTRHSVKTHCEESFRMSDNANSFLSAVECHDKRYAMFDGRRNLMTAQKVPCECVCI